MYIGCLVISGLAAVCEQARLPHLQGEAFVLAEGHTKPTIRSVSDEASRFGIIAGQSVAGARTLCPDLIVLPYDRTAYEAAAYPIWDAIAALSDTVEPVSPEIAFFLLSPRHAEHDAVLIAARLSRAVGTPVQIGIGRSKLVAERAARVGTEDKGKGPVFVPVGEEAALLAVLPITRVAELPRRIIGKIRLDRAMILRLERLGIRTLGDALALPLDRLPRVLRPVGQLLRDLAYGVDRDPVRSLWPPQVLTEVVRFNEEDAVENRFFAENALNPLAARIACSLSANSQFCRTLTVRAGLVNNSFLEKQDRFVVPLSHSSDLHHYAIRLLALLTIDQPITSLSLIAGEISAGTGAQLALPSLSDARKMPAEIRKVRLAAALDFLRREFGLRAVLTGQQMVQSRRAVLYGAQPLGHLLSDYVQVATSESGQPIRYWRRLRGRREVTCYEVRRVADRWRESKWRADLSVTDAEVWRIETDPFGIGDLRRVGAQWQITAQMD